MILVKQRNKINTPRNTIKPQPELQETQGGTTKPPTTTQKDDQKQAESSKRNNPTPAKHLQK